jgi:hypothetical protein
MLGLSRNIQATLDNILDIVPCDIVSNLIIAATAYSAFQPGPCLNVYHASSSATNKVTISSYRETLLPYTNYYPVQKMVRDPHVTIIRNKKLWRLRRFFDEELPTLLL